MSTQSSPSCFSIPQTNKEHNRFPLLSTNKRNPHCASHTNTHTMISPCKGAHILVIPFPAQGHMLPLLDFTHQLANRGLTITILVTPKNLPILNPLLSSHPSIQTLVFPLPHHPSLPSGIENAKDIGNSGNVLLINAFGKLHDPIIHWFNTHTNPPVAILSDFFLGWTHHLAQQIGIPNVGFCTSGAFLTAVTNHLWHNLESLHSLGEVDFLDLPHSPSFTREHLPSLFLRYVKSDPDWEFVKDTMKANTSSWACVINTFEALDAEYMEFLRRQLGHGRVFAVGPLNLVSGMDQMGRGKSNSSDLSHDVFTWLDGCLDESVLYVCFGSQKLMKQDQMEALAIGLELSGIPFVWVVKPLTPEQAANGYGSVPDGFEARVVGRGVVIKGWAPQVPILSHRAVGGFLSHCGWNSVLEAIVAGVMVLAWPMEADQYVNAEQLVEYQGAAVHVCAGPDTVPDSAKLARIIAESMNGNVAEKKRAKKLKDNALDAVKEGGSSSEDLNAFIRELNQPQGKIVG